MAREAGEHKECNIYINKVGKNEVHHTLIHSVWLQLLVSYTMSSESKKEQINCLVGRWLLPVCFCHPF